MTLHMPEDERAIWRRLSHLAACIAHAEAHPEEREHWEAHMPAWRAELEDLSERLTAWRESLWSEDERRSA